MDEINADARSGRAWSQIVIPEGLPLEADEGADTGAASNLLDLSGLDALSSE